eukprot:gene29362-32971_t
MNVVHAGLELLRTELEATGAFRSVLELLQDIYFASETAIEILNEMLQFEHMDSGTFKLECVVTQLFKCFENRLNSFKYMAAKKSIELTIEDLAQVSEFFIFEAETESQDESIGQKILYIDRFRVEQIIRNLVTNAIKFTPEGGRVTIRFQLIEDDGQCLSAEALLHVIPPEVALTLVSARSFLRIEVADTGA